MRFFRSLARLPRRGSNAIEFAMTLPVFALIMYGMMDFGYYFARMAAFDSAVSEGCRQGAMIDENSGDPIATADAEIQSYLTGLGFTCGGGCVVTVADTGDVVPNRAIECSITATHSAIIGYSPMPANVDSSTVMRLEWQR